MSTKSASTVTVTVDAIGIDVTKTAIGSGFVDRTSDDGEYSLKHLKSTTKAGRNRRIVQFRRDFVDAEGYTQSYTAQFSTDSMPEHATEIGDAFKGMVDFLAATSHVESDLLVSGQNLG
jgi:hypothetical protein